MESLLLTLMYFGVSIAIILVGVFIFELLTTKYKDWDEILKGNNAVALSIAGKITGISIILGFSIYHSVQLLDTVIWGAIGVVLQMVGYLLFELFTRRFSVEDQLHKGNISVGIISFAVSVGIALVVGASIT
ncbi:DUF350 domain-containing protein [Mangrovibacillus cuniculi]|uniref:DUF350 domain-containing protein n=1 Tax=Mangrovibacillus cuniculi TaxID=2593652 RepID=A0A7S8CEJ2_9BACI|nr:DUF350 domain-containing protein [Mangrovibacillus cuniculi]QPC48461.1 DUF350 domain-containing protein [Mangrovibacillus cuniculi]